MVSRSESRRRVAIHPVRIEEAELPGGREGWRARCHGCFWQSAKYVRRRTAEIRRAAHLSDFPPIAGRPPCAAVHPEYSGVTCQLPRLDHGVLHGHDLGPGTHPVFWQDPPKVRPGARRWR
jgi:hypothetical protein